ncbi:hypothetical protein [Caulobacter soli]|uniref:hypothetical protein n=1 Tax=Caulobacter soli TaxID=2708539 RepID=UPI0013EB6879|nr:hypothetical protein [Caulobacter soli]
MKPRIRASLVVALVVGELAMAGSAGAQYAYPAKGQSQAQQQKDETACSHWATQQTGFDPMHPPVVAQASAAPVTGSGARVKGAAVGAGIGAISGGDAGDAAVAGAVAGGVMRRSKNRRAARAQNEAAEQQVAATQAGFDQARAACLTGRGYTLGGPR